MTALLQINTRVFLFMSHLVQLSIIAMNTKWLHPIFFLQFQKMESGFEAYSKIINGLSEREAHDALTATVSNIETFPMITIDVHSMYNS